MDNTLKFPATEQNETKCDAKDQAIAKILLEAPATTNQEIATKLGLSRQTVSRRRNRRVVQQLVLQPLSFTHESIRELSVKAMNRLAELLDHSDARIQLLAAGHILKLGTLALEQDPSSKDVDKKSVVYISEWGNSRAENWEE